MKMPKFDNGAVREVKAFGSFLKETARTEILKKKIQLRKSEVAAVQRMQSGKSNTYEHSAGMARGVSKKKGS